MPRYRIIFVTTRESRPIKLGDFENILTKTYTNAHDTVDFDVD